jgi:arylsulfatase A-like enzyme
LAEFARRGWDEDLLLIVTSDHGESFGEHDLFIHGDGLYRELISVPLIFHWKKRLPTGVRVSEPVSLAGLPATIMDLLGETGQSTFRWPSFHPIWERRTKPEAQPWPASQLAKGGLMHSLVAGEWHYISDSDNGEQLYHWPSDPGEMRNRIAEPEQASLVAEFRARIAKLSSQQPPDCKSPEKAKGR